MPLVPLRGLSILLLSLGLVVSLATFFLARVQLIQVKALSIGQTAAFNRALARLPVADRLLELKNRSSSQTIARRIADEALLVDEPLRAAAIDEVLGDLALSLEARASWPRAAVRIAGASGVLLMAVSISLHAEVFVSVVLLLSGIGSAIVCMMIQQRAEAVATQIRREVDALIDALGVREGSDSRRSSINGTRFDRRGRRHRT